MSHAVSVKLDADIERLVAMIGNANGLLAGMLVHMHDDELIDCVVYVAFKSITESTNSNFYKICIW